jgi:hypothetical protein
VTGDKAPPPTGKELARAKRDARLADALRRNLKRRKAAATGETKAAQAKLPTK